MTLKDTLLGLFIIVIWGVNFVVIAWGLDGIPPLLMGAERFLLVYKQHKGIESALVTTAIPLDNDLRGAIQEFVEKHGGGQVELTEKVDEKLIGGAVIRIGDRQLDASVLRQINDLKQTFNNNLYIKDF